MAQAPSPIYSFVAATPPTHASDAGTWPHGCLSPVSRNHVQGRHVHQGAANRRVHEEEVRRPLRFVHGDGLPPRDGGVRLVAHCLPPKWVRFVLPVLPILPTIARSTVDARLHRAVGCSAFARLTRALQSLPIATPHTNLQGTARRMESASKRRWRPPHAPEGSHATLAARL